MKHKQHNSNSSDAWKKMGIAAVLIVAAFGFLLFLEGKMTGLAASGSTPVSISNIILTEASPNKIAYVSTVSLPSGEKNGAITLNLGGAGGTKKQGKFIVSKDLKEVNLSLAPLSDYGYFKVSENYLLKKGVAQSKPISVNLSKMKDGKLVNVTVPATLSITYNGIKYFKNTKTNKIDAKASLFFQLFLDQPLDLSDGLVKKELQMPDDEEKFIYNGLIYAGLSINGKTYPFKMLMDPSGEAAIYFNKLSDSVELTKSTTFPVEKNGKVKVTVWGWSEDGAKLVADVQWIKPTV